MEKLDLTVIKTRCQCGKLASEVAYDDDSAFEMLFEKYGSLDNHNYFICECGQTIRMHYTGYDCLLEEYDYLEGIQSNDDTFMLEKCGSWVKNHKWQFIDKSELDGLSKEYHTFNEFIAYEKYTFMRKGFEFMKVVHNTIHNQYQCYKFVAEDDKLLDLFNYFNK